MRRMFILQAFLYIQLVLYLGAGVYVIWDQLRNL